MTTYQGIIFDVDGVLINTENMHYLAYKHVLSRRGIDLSLDQYKEYFAGKSIKGGVSSFLLAHELPDGQTPESFLQNVKTEKIAHTIELFSKELVYFNDTLEFIQQIRYGDIVVNGVGYVTPKPFLAITTGLELILMDEVLKKYDLKEIISVVVTPELYAHSKPHPECYQLTAYKMGLPVESLVGVEDSPAGVDALNAAGILSFAITNTSTAKELGNARIVTDSLRNLVS